MSNKDKLEATAVTLGEVATFADYLQVLAVGAGEAVKADRIGEQAVVLRDYEGLYRTAAASADG